MSTNFHTAQIVNAISEEYEIVETTKCSCGGTWTVLLQSLVDNEKKYYDLLTCKCNRCNMKRDFVFDINSFFGKGWIV